MMSRFLTVIILAIGMFCVPAGAVQAALVGVDIGIDPGDTAGWFSGNATQGYFVNGGGAGIGGNSDQFYFLHEEGVGTDFVVTAQVADMLGLTGPEQAGLMIRDSLEPNSANASTLMTYFFGANGHWRTVAGDPAQEANDPFPIAPYWVRVARSGDLFTSSVSFDENTWTDLSSQTIPMSGSVFVGMAVSSFEPTFTMEADFQDFVISGSFSPIMSLTWNNTTGNWSDKFWTDEGAATTDVPNAQADATINGGAVTVGLMDAAANNLTMGGGGLTIADGRTLAVGGKLDVADGVPIVLEGGVTGATLTVGDGSVPSLQSSGNVTIGSTTEFTVGTLDTGTAAGTFTKLGPGTLRLNNDSGTNVTIGAEMTVRVERGELISTGTTPLDQATLIELASGALELDTLPKSPTIGTPTISINFASDEPIEDPDDPSTASLVTGAAGVLGSANWNNLAGQNGGPSTLIDDTGATTATSVTWASDVGTWSSTGRGEDNNTAPPGNDRNLMTGYLDTNDTSTTTVTVAGLDSTFTDMGYQVYVYIKGGVNDRGGDYTIGRQTQSHVDTAAFDGTYVPGPEGDYLVFVARDPSFTLTATPTNTDLFRAPLNAIEISALPLVELDMSGTDVVVSDHSTLTVGSGRPVDFGELTLESGILTTSGMAPINFASAKIELAPGATLVGIAPETETSFGPEGIDGSAVTESFIFSKAGPSSMTVEAGDFKGMDHATIDVSEGVLEMIGEDAWAGATEGRLSGGVLAVGPSGSGVKGISVNFGADEPDGARSDVTGAAGVFGNAVWNNLDSATGISGPLVDDSGTTTTATVEWTSNNTWASAGRSENNNSAADGPDRNLMIGYLDTTDVSITEVDVNGLGDDLTVPGYDVYLYIQGGVIGRGGSYTIGAETQTNVTMGAFDGTYIEGAEGNFLVFEDLHDASFHLEATPTTAAFVRAPLNGIQLVEAGAVPPQFETMDLLDKRLSVVEGSMLNVMAPAGAKFGPLVMENGVLTVVGSGPASFAGTTIGDTADTVGFDPQTPLDLGGIDGNDRDVQISKVGDGDLVLDDPGVRLDGATFDAQGGRLIGLGSGVFGGATLEAGTGELVLGAAADDTSPVAFPNPVVASGNGILTAGKGDQPNAADAPMTVQVPSVSVDGNLNLRSTDDYTLEVAGEVSGSGKLTLQEGNLLFSGGGSVPNVSVYQNAQVATGPDGISATNKLRVGGASYLVNSGEIVLNESDPAAGTATLTLADSEVTVLPKEAPEGAVLHYSFDVENDAGHDDSGNGFTGTLNGGIQWTDDGRLGGALDFISWDTHVLAETFSLDTDTITFAAWVNGNNNTGVDPDIDEWCAVLASRDPSANSMGFSARNDNLHYHWEDDPAAYNWDDGPVIPEDEWVFLAVTVEPDKATAYVWSEAGGLQSGENVRAHGEQHIGQLYVGRDATSGNTRYVVGRIDEPRIYDRALDADEILDLLEAGGDPSADLATNNLIVSGNSTLNSELGASTTVTMGDLTLQSGSNLTLSGMAMGSFNNIVSDGGTVTGDVAVRGTLLAGDVPATLNVAENDAAGFSGALDFEDGAVFSVSFGEGPGGEGIADKLVTDGDVQLGGTAKLELEISGADGGARMFKKGVYELIETSISSEGGVGGSFAEVTDLNGYVSADVDEDRDEYGIEKPSFNTLTLTIDCNLLAGDANLDTVTDVRDFNKWNANKFTSGTEWISGDFNGDDVTDVRDFNIWNANKFTSATCTTPGGLVEGQVPEPGTLALLACGLAGLLLVWRRRR